MKNLLFLTVLIFLTLPTSQAAQVNVAVATNFVGSLRTLVPLFEQKTGHHLRISSASSGVLFAQINQGAPFDIYLAANTSYPKKIMEKGLGVAGSRNTYATARLVLTSNNKQLLQGADLARIVITSRGKISLANPRTAPYGMAAVQTLKKLAVWDEVQTRIVTGENVGQAFQFVATGNAILGFVALSQILSFNDGVTRDYLEIPAFLYSPLEQQMVLLKRASEKVAAHAFMDFLLAPEIQALLAEKGYGRQHP